MTLRTRLLAGCALIFVVVVAAGVFTVQAQRSQLYNQVDDRLTATPIPPEVRAPPTDRAPARPEAREVDSDNISEVYVATLSDDDGVQAVIRGQLLEDAPELDQLTQAAPTEITIFTADGVDGISTFRVLFLPSNETSVDVIVAVPIDDVDDSIRQLALTFAGAAALILLTLVLVASWVNRFGLRPISTITDVAEGISSGDHDRRADVGDDSTEAGRLGHAFNVMLDERDRSDARLREFVSNASHELRTPLTSIRGYLDLYAAGGFREPDELDDAIRRMQAEAERMNLLVEDLLVLAKFDEEQPLDFTQVRLDTLAEDVATLALAAHPERQIGVEADTPVEATVDRLRLHQALAAVVDNAVRHTPADASIRISVTTSGDNVELAVIDNGPGLTAEDAATVFDRFSRGDRSRARRTGGSGLGLSIAQTILRAHGGNISTASTPGGGATFIFTLPSHRERSVAATEASGRT